MRADVAARLTEAPVMSTDSARRSGFSRGDTASAAAYVREAAFTVGNMRLVAAVASSRGKHHAVNEDGYSTLDAGVPLFVVADGVGSGALASCASRDLVASLHAALAHENVDEAAVANALLDADREIRRSIASRSDNPGAATVALCLATDASLSHWLVAWVGDCRVYRLRSTANDAAELLTVDDTYAQLNEAPPPGGSPGDPARMVGNGAVDAPNVRSVVLSADEMLILCSDGIHRHADAPVLTRLLRGPSSLSRRCVRLIEFVRARGGGDDATVLIVHRASQPRSRLPRIARLVRIVSIAACIVALASALVWLAADRASAQRLAPESHPLTSQVQP